MTIRFNSLFPVLLVASLVWGGSVHSTYAQEVEGAVRIDNPPEVLESGSLLDLFAAFREGEHQIHLEFESDAPFVPVQFQTVVRKDGKTLGRATRDPMPYFPGDMLMCPEAFDFVPIMRRYADSSGQLPAGKYAIVISVIVEGMENAQIEPAEMQFTVPKR